MDRHDFQLWMQCIHIELGFWGLCSICHAAEILVHFDVIILPLYIYLKKEHIMKQVVSVT
jgi:hypothetical protein